MAPSPQNPTPQWLKWLVLGFIFYAGYLHLTGKNAATLGGSEDGNGGYVASKAADVTTVTNESGFSIPNDIQGAGDPATCGQTATVTVAARRANGEPVAISDGQPITLNVGVPKPDKPWAGAVVGMKPGGVREVSLSGHVFDEKTRADLNLEESDTLRVMLTLQTLSPSIAVGKLAFLATDLENGLGEVARCGRQAEVHLTLWNPDGSVNYSSREAKAPLKLVIGESKLFYGLDRALLNMRAGGTRRAVIPAAYLTAAEHAPAAAFTFPHDQTLIADVQLLNVTDTK